MTTKYLFWPPSSVQTGFWPQIRCSPVYLGCLGVILSVFQKKAILHVKWSFSRNDPKKPYNQLKYCPNMFLTKNMMFPRLFGGVGGYFKCLLENSEKWLKILILPYILPWLGKYILKWKCLNFFTNDWKLYSLVKKQFGSRYLHL